MYPFKIVLCSIIYVCIRTVSCKCVQQGILLFDEFFFLSNISFIFIELCTNLESKVIRFSETLFMIDQAHCAPILSIYFLDRVINCLMHLLDPIFMIQNIKLLFLKKIAYFFKLFLVCLNGKYIVNMYSIFMYVLNNNLKLFFSDK